MMFLRNNVNYIEQQDVNAYLDKFDNFPWSIEPQESWKEICKQRALQIRESYDYIILYFSGGSDSTTVLNSFLDNNIYIDEIVTTVYEGIDEPSLDGKKAENDLRSKNYTGKFTKVTITYDKVKTLLTSDLFLSDNQNFTGQIHNLSRFNLHGLQHFSVNKVNDSNKICHLIGEHNPNVECIHDHYYAIIDIKQKFISNNYYQNTLFFTDIDFPKIHIKQCYEVAKLMKKYSYLNQNQLKLLKHLAVRDFYSPLITPTKHSDYPLFSIDFPTVYSEGNILLSAYSKHDDKFKDLYTRASLLPQIPITKKIVELNKKTKRKYLLF